MTTLPPETEGLSVEEIADLIVSKAAQFTKNLGQPAFGSEIRRQVAKAILYECQKGWCQGYDAAISEMYIGNAQQERRKGWEMRGEADAKALRYWWDDDESDNHTDPVKVIANLPFPGDPKP